MIFRSVTWGQHVQPMRSGVSGWITIYFFKSSPSHISLVFQSNSLDLFWICSARKQAISLKQSKAKLPHWHFYTNVPTQPKRTQTHLRRILISSMGVWPSPMGVLHHWQLYEIVEFLKATNQQQCRQDYGNEKQSGIRKQHFVPKRWIGHEKT